MAPSDFLRVSTMAKIQMSPPKTLSRAYRRKAPPMPNWESNNGKLRPTKRLSDLRTVQRNGCALRVMLPDMLGLQRPAQTTAAFSCKRCCVACPESHQFSAVQTLATLALM